MRSKTIEASCMERHDYRVRLVRRENEKLPNGNIRYLVFINTCKRFALMIERMATSYFNSEKGREISSAKARGNSALV